MENTREVPTYPVIIKKDPPLLWHKQITPNQIVLVIKMLHEKDQTKPQKLFPVRLEAEVTTLLGITRKSEGIQACSFTCSFLR